jgi:hypothetical protein
MPGEKTKEISVSTQSRMFRRLMFFNRFSHERIRPMWVLYFGLADEADYLLDFYACSVDEETIERQEDDLLRFVGHATTPVPENIAPWRPKVSAIARVEVANVILAARTGPVAELRLFNYSQGDVLAAQQEGKSEIEGAPVALLRCEESLQRAMFMSWYSKRGPAR